MSHQQSVIARRASQISILRKPRSPIFTLSADRCSRWRLSNEATHVSFNPSSDPRQISVGMFRTVRVTGATTIPLRTPIASERVTTTPADAKFPPVPTRSRPDGACLPRFFLHESTRCLLDARILPIGLRETSICDRNRVSYFLASVAVNQLLETNPNGIGATPRNTIMNEVVDLLGERIVNSCNQLCHANSMPICNASLAR